MDSFGVCDMKCPECGFENTEGSQFCRSCGSPLPKTVSMPSGWGSEGAGGSAPREKSQGTGHGTSGSTRPGMDSTGLGSTAHKASSSSRSSRGSSSGSRGTRIRAGMRLGTYEVRNELGHGAMARVWRAYDTRLQRDVAIKEPMFDRSLDKQALQELGRRFVGEGRTAARLNHPNIVSVYSAEVLEGRPIIVMELIEGETLTQMLSRGPLAPPVALSLLDGLLDAVSYAHERGIVHRDIKPDNVFVTRDGKVKLGDFGIAHVDDGKTSHLTATGTVIGTPGYMSPEQAMGAAVDERSDLFSVGVIGYEMLSGRNPFGADQGVSTATLLYRIVHEPAPMLPETIGGKLPCDLRGGIMAALQKDPAARPQSAADLKYMLHHVPTRGTASQGVAPVAAPPQVQQRSGGSSVKVLGIVVGVLSMILAAMLVIAIPRIVGGDGDAQDDGSGSSQVGDSYNQDVDEVADEEPETDPEPEPEPEPEPVYSEPSFTNADCSSYRAYDGYSNYGPELAIDNDANTAWNEGASGNGIGEYLIVSAGSTQYVSGIDIRNGYQKVSSKYPNGELFYYNNRPSNVTISLADGYSQTFDLADAKGWQRLDFGDVHETTYIKVTINSVIEGTRWPDTCISDIHAFASSENSYS